MKHEVRKNQRNAAEASSASTGQGILLNARIIYLPETLLVDMTTPYPK